MANDLNFTQLATVLNEMHQQTTGQKQIAPINTADFVTVAQTMLKTGYDPVIQAVSQVLSRTIFSIRPYNAKFKGLMVDSIKWGNHVRKLQTVDKNFETDDRLPLEDGKSVDPWKINKPVVLQTNFYGQNVFQKSLTLFKDQLDTAFSSPEEFGRFVTMVMQNASDQIEQAHEEVKRATLSNFIGGKLAGDADNVIHLVTEYNDAKGTALTTDTVMQPANFPDFAKWTFARIGILASLLSERSAKYHVNITGKTIMRHTPPRNLKMYLFGDYVKEIDTNVLSGVYHNDYLKYADYEAVNFWQSIESRDGINITPSYMDNTGAIVTPEEAVVQGNIFGVLFDDEAIGVTSVNQWSQSTQLNPRGGYSNIFWHFTDRYWNDFTENGLVLLLD